MPLPFASATGRRGLARLVGGRAEALRALEDLLARAERVRDVSAEQVGELASRYGLDLKHRLRTARCQLYRRFLEHCFADQELSPEESAEVAHLRLLLALSDEDAAGIHEQVARSVYGRAIDQVLQDQRLDPEEEDFLRRLGRDLALPESDASRLLDEGAGRARQRFIASAVTHGHGFLAPVDRVLELHGTSEASLEQAIADALAEAARAVPELRGFEVTRIGGEVQGGRVVRWEVALRAALGELK